MRPKRIISVVCAGAIMITPLIVAAHGGIDDGHIEGDGHAGGASALLAAFSLAWWGLLTVSIALAGTLSFIVSRYLRVSSSKKENTQKS